MTTSLDIRNPFISHPDGTTTVLTFHRGCLTAFLVDTTDLPKLAGRTWCVVRNGAVRRVDARIGRKCIKLHRWLLQPPATLDVDHINFDSLDDRRSNLRVVTTS